MRLCVGVEVLPINAARFLYADGAREATCNGQVVDHFIGIKMANWCQNVVSGSKYRCTWITTIGTVYTVTHSNNVHTYVWEVLRITSGAIWIATSPSAVCVSLLEGVRVRLGPIDQINFGSFLQLLQRIFISPLVWSTIGDTSYYALF